MEKSRICGSNMKSQIINGSENRLRREKETAKQNKLKPEQEMKVRVNHRQIKLARGGKKDRKKKRQLKKSILTTQIGD